MSAKRRRADEKDNHDKTFVSDRRAKKSESKPRQHLDEEHNESDGEDDDEDGGDKTKKGFKGPIEEKERKQHKEDEEKEDEDYEEDDDEDDDSLQELPDEDDDPFPFDDDPPAPLKKKTKTTEKRKKKTNEKSSSESRREREIKQAKRQQQWQLKLLSGFGKEEWDKAAKREASALEHLQSAKQLVADAAKAERNAKRWRKEAGQHQDDAKKDRRRKSIWLERSIVKQLKNHQKNINEEWTDSVQKAVDKATTDAQSQYPLWNESLFWMERRDKMDKMDDKHKKNNRKKKNKNNDANNDNVNNVVKEDKKVVSASLASDRHGDHLSARQRREIQDQAEDQAETTAILDLVPILQCKLDTQLECRNRRKVPSHSGMSLVVRFPPRVRFLHLTSGNNTLCKPSSSSPMIASSSSPPQLVFLFIDFKRNAQLRRSHHVRIKCLTREQVESLSIARAFPAAAQGWTEALLSRSLPAVLVQLIISYITAYYDRGRRDVLQDSKGSKGSKSSMRPRSTICSSDVEELEEDI